MAHYVTLEGLDRVPFRVSGNQAAEYGDREQIDIDSVASARALLNYRGEFFTVPYLDLPLRHAGATSTTTTDSGLAFKADKDYTILSVSATVGTAPAGGAELYDVHLATTRDGAGASIFTGAGERLSIAAAANVNTGGALGTTVLAAGEYLRVEIDQVGSGTAAEDLVVIFHLGAH